MSKLVFGCGYLGRRVARRWREAGDDVFVVTRSATRARELAGEGYAPLVADVTQPASLANLPECDSVLYAIGFDRTAGRSMREVYVEGLQAVLDALSPDTGKLLYVSTTGIYGQAAGKVVDEDSPTEPTREGGRVSLAAERLLDAHALGRRAIVLRLAGLYGPLRVPYLHDIGAGRPLAAPAEGVLNLIHVDDAASVVVAADEEAEPPRTYLVADGNPVERRAYFEELARLLGAPAPRFAAPAADSPAAERAAGSKRVRNARMTAELATVLKYPSYREGLAAIVAAENAQSSRP